MFSDVRECFAQLNPFLCGKGRMGKTSNEGIVMVLPWNWLRTGASRVPCFLLFESLLTYLGIHQEETTNLPANVLGQQRSLPNLRNLELSSHANFTEQSRIPITQYGPFTAPVKQVCMPHSNRSSVDRVEWGMQVVRHLFKKQFIRREPSFLLYNILLPARFKYIFVAKPVIVGSERFTYRKNSPWQVQSKKTFQRVRPVNPNKMLTVCNRKFLSKYSVMIRNSTLS